MAFATSLMRRFGFLGGGEFEHLAMTKTLNEKFGENEATSIFDDLVWINDPDAPTYVSGKIRNNFVPGRTGQLTTSMLSEDANLEQRVSDQK